MFNIENNHLTITAKEKGGELTSIKSKKSNIEYLWQGNSEYWSGQAPLLFPIVGTVKNNIYTIEGKEYSLPRHGLARTSNFKLIHREKDSLTFELKFSEESLKAYPYKFSFEVTYKLKDTSLRVIHKVINRDDKEIYFSLGGHPAFNCPMLPEESSRDYYFEFEKEETCTLVPLNEEGYFKRETLPYLRDEKIINITENLFEKDALVFGDLASRAVFLKSKNHNNSIRVDFQDFKWLGLWSKSSDAPFVCIEPWLGHADYEDYEGDFRHREGTIRLEANKEFIGEYSITIIE